MQSSSPRGQRIKKKSKRLDAIDENEYKRNHLQGGDGGAGPGPGPGSGGGGESGLRRSSRDRRAPVMLDLTPAPLKKRRKVDRNAKLSGEKSVKEEEVERNLKYCLRSRSRSRAGRLGFGKGKRKMKLFEEKVVGSEVDDEDEDEDEGLEGGRPKFVKSKRPGRVRAAHGLEQDEENELVEMRDENVDEEEDAMRQDEDDVVQLDSKIVGGLEKETAEGDSSKMSEWEQSAQLEEGCIGNENVETVDRVETTEHGDRQVEEYLLCMIEETNAKKMEQEQVDSVVEVGSQSVAIEAVDVPTNEEKSKFMEAVDVPTNEGQSKPIEAVDAPTNEDQREAIEVVDVPTNEDQSVAIESIDVQVNLVGAGSCHDKKDANSSKHDDEPAAEVNNNVTVDNLKIGKSRIKVGRRCGLCGGGTDGMPPKILAQDMVDKENETYSSSSSSEKCDYNIWDGFGDEPGWLGRLFGPINDRYGIAGTWVHQHCAVWSPEVYFAGVGCLKNIRAALFRGRALKCTRCGRPGATIGCRVDRCPRTYHLPCARAMNCVFDHRKFLIACTGHWKLFQPLGYQYIASRKKLKAKKMKLEIRKLSNDAWRKDIGAEEKWLENCGDDEEFLKRESKRLQRDLARIAPVYIGGSDPESGKLFQGWESVAGLQNVIRCMKEVVILPLLYPEFFESLSLTPPRGVLLHGYPGTGKTLVVRALIGACARGDKRIAYFARKGADCLGKYVGDAERQLRLLFQVAEKCQPSIIFFDEIDGLAPSRTRQQDQTHSSVVSTLLALMDGLKSRGSVVVIGATNRPDAVDPALRRPGRFDREIYFPLPSEEDRASILSLHTQKWPKPVSGSVLKSIATGTAGFAGADLQALCTQAAIISLKRNFPLQKVLSTAGKKDSKSKCFPLPAFAVEDRDWLEALSHSPPPCSRREVGIAANEVVSSPLPSHLVPCLLQPLSTMLVYLYLDERIWLPTSLRRAATLIESVVISTLNKKKVISDRWWAHIDVLFHEEDVAKDIERKLLQAGILLGDSTVADSDVCNDDGDDRLLNVEPSVNHCGGTRPSLLQNTAVTSTNKPGFRILISGSPRSGQRHLASCLLHCFVGNVEIQKVDLATVLLEGHGDMEQRITQILKKCASVGSCVVFMPRIDLWAVEKPKEVAEASDSDLPNHHQLPENEKHRLPDNEKSRHAYGQVVEDGSGSLSKQCKSEEMVECQEIIQNPSHAWNMFMEQVESLGVSASLMILATSEVPCSELPVRIRHFFKSDISNSHRSVPVKHTVPRFSVQVDGNIKHDLVINVSSAELSRDIVRQVVLLVHQTSHIHTTSFERDCHNSNGQTDMDDHSADRGSADANHNFNLRSDESLKAPPISKNIVANGKSSLLLAITSFGYQILRYPHFAELCWFTSKLKVGPLADISGPWKGWPFNSCIVRPNDSPKMVAVVKKIKGKENYGLVRGLIAVGLLAYRGMYTSLREVSSEVRKVLEILVAQINVKIQAGKDRCQYIRLLSQVAYLEDVVNSWAYTLQSLEVDAPLNLANAKPMAVRSLDDDHEENQLQNDDSKPEVSTKCSKEHEGREIGGERLDTKKSICIDVNEEVPDLGGLVNLDCSGQKIVLSESNPEKPLQDFNEILNNQNGTIPKPPESENDNNQTVVMGNSGSLKHPNEFVCTEFVAIPESVLTSTKSGDIKLFSSGTSSNSLNCLLSTEASSGHHDGKADVNEFRSGTSFPECLDKPDADEHIIDVNISRKTSLPDCPDKADIDEHIVDTIFSPKTSLTTKSGFICVYHCCSKCLDTLHSFTQSTLTEEWRSNGSQWTVDDFHDIVASLSAYLLSAVRKIHVFGGYSNSFDHKWRLINNETFESPESGTCDCNAARNNILSPAECICHRSRQSFPGKAAASANTYLGFGAKYVFRDSVLVHTDPDNDARFHCKYETLCLCSLIELIVRIKPPFH